MKQGVAKLVELYLEDGRTGGRVTASGELIPAPGQYLLADLPGSDSPLPVPVFSAGSTPDGFLLAPPLPAAWLPGMVLSLRGPLGRGFSPPTTADRVALAALGGTISRLSPLITASLELGASVVLVADHIPSDLSPDVEVQPLSSLAEVRDWADYLAVDVPRESLSVLRDVVGNRAGRKQQPRVEVLVTTPMPCGGIAECGVCAVPGPRGWKMACREGPVFDVSAIQLAGD